MGPARVSDSISSPQTRTFCPLYFARVLPILAFLMLAGPAVVLPPTGLAQSSSAPAAQPEPIFSITWTAQGQLFSDTTDENGSRTVTRRHVIMTGSSIERKYGDGSRDNYPFDLTVTDDLQSDVTSPCYGGGYSPSHDSWKILDPARYQFGPDAYPKLLDPYQHSDGTWWVLDPFGGFYYNRYFAYLFHSDSTGCDGTFASTDFTNPQGTPYVVLGGYGDPNEIPGDAAGKVFSKTWQFTWIDGYGTMPVTWDFTARLLLGRDLTVDRLEVTQGLQDLANSIPIVQDKRTVVRAYLGVGKDQVPVPNVTGKLTGYSGNTVLGTVRPFNPGARITAPISPPDWHILDHTLNFELPLAWTEQPSLRLEVEVNDDKRVSEIDYSNNKRSATVTTMSCSPVSIAYALVHYTPPEGFTPPDPSANIFKGQEFMRKIYPIADKELKYQPWPSLTWTKSISTSAGGTQLVAELDKRLLMSSAPRPDRLYGWSPSLASPDNGMAEEPGIAGFGNDTESPNRWRRTFAHEIGHTYGLIHNGDTTNGRHWFDVYDRSIKPPNVGGELLDVMVPNKTEPEAWVSPQSYLYLLSKQCVFTLAGPQALTATDNLIVSGTLISGTNAITGTLDPVYRTTTAPLYVPPIGVPYCVNLKNANALLSQSCFAAGFDGDGAPATSIPFGMVITNPVGVSIVELTRAGLVLSTRTASANPPTITVTFPNAPGLTLSGTQTLAWTGSDPDANLLTYNVLYSSDNGATWIGVGSGITGTSYTLNFGSVPGGSQDLIKVMASDGFHSAEDVSNNPFNVANKPPMAVIVSPPAGASFPANTEVPLQGVGLDLEQGSLGDSALSWVSNNNGALGTGRFLQVYLSPGLHTITLTATDSNALTSTATIQLTVQDLTDRVVLPAIFRGP